MSGELEGCWSILLVTLCSKCGVSVYVYMYTNNLIIM